MEISPKQYPAFWKSTIINCNRIVESYLNDVIDKYIRGKLEIKKDMELWIVEKIRKGVIDSPIIDKRIKKYF